MSKKVMVAMSGGVDSAVTALLLQRQGYEVCGATMKLFQNEEIGLEYESTCCSLADVEDARSVARRLGFQHHVFGFSKQFRTDVIQRFADSYTKGETPNPCIDCNRFVKFPLILERALLLEQDYIATGHYARVEQDPVSGRWLLKKAKDRSKDQTYVLYALTQQQLSRLLLPLGELEKKEVRAIAEEESLVVADKPDSQDICFVKDGDYAGFLTDVMGAPPQPGQLVDSSGNVLGAHRGIIYYTIGQRKGLPVNFAKPQYVLRKDAGTATVTVGDHEALFSGGLIAGDVNWISVENPAEALEVTVKTRYQQAEVPAVLYPLEGGRVRVRFESPQRAVTPGQAVVFYSGDSVVGGGTIASSEK